jgi:hypothetical protein
MVPVMWSVWGALVLIMAVLFIYRSNLSKNEEDQVFLDDAFSHERTAQAAIVAKINRVQPLIRAAMALVGVATVVVVGYYLFDIFKQFK